MHVALILTPVWSREMPHLAIAMLSSFLRRDGHDVIVFDLNNEFYHKVSDEYKNKWLKQRDLFWIDNSFITRFISENEGLIQSAIKNILETGARIIGFSVYYPNELISLELARRIKEIDKDRIIIFGGPQCLREHNGGRLIQEDAVDIVVTGEGEETLLDLTRSIERDGKANVCEGALFKLNGDVFDGGDRSPIKNLDALPYADFSDVGLSQYESDSILPVLSSRGCIQKCVYCTVNAYWKRYRSFSGERLFQELEYQLTLYKEVKEFYFYDPLLNGNIKNLECFCDLMIERKKDNGFSSVSWQGEGIIRPEMSMELLRKMKNAGCYRLAYGIESGSQGVVDKMKKRFKIADAERVIRQTSEQGVKVSLNFMFGFPTETSEDFKKTLEFLKRNHMYIDVVIPSEAFCSIHANTYLYSHPEEFGISSNFHSDFWESLNGKNNYVERLRRFESFCELAESLNVHVGSGYSKVKMFKERQIEEYHKYAASKKGEEAEVKDEALHSNPGENNKISFSWDLHYKCNYRCPYCWFHGKWKDLEKTHSHFSADKWIKQWKLIHDKYGSINIDVLGGEPFIYPGFVELMRNVSLLHKLTITTNLSADLDNFVREVDSSNVTINPTFHPLFSSLEQFLDRILILKEKGFTRTALYLAYPPHIHRLDYYRGIFESKGLFFGVLTFWGEYKGISYPDGYTEDERRIIGGSLASREGESFQISPKNVNKKLCQAGYRYAVIKSNGDVLRCGGGQSNELIGNFFDENFKLLDKPLPCKAEYCRCNEWAFLLVDKNDREE